MSQNCKCRWMKVFQLLMPSIKEDEYLYRGERCTGEHFSIAAESQKCNQVLLLPSCVSPNSPSINSLLKTQTHRFLPLLCAPYMSSPHIRSKESTHIHSSLKTFFWRDQKAQSIHECVWVTESPCDQRKFTACRLSSDKSTGQNESEIGKLTEAVQRALAEL